MPLGIFKCYLASTVILGFASDIFRHIRPLFKSIFTHIRHPWHIPITKHIQTPRHIFNTISNIFAKLRLGLMLQFRMYLVSLLQMLSNFSINFTVSLTLYFRHAQDLLNHICSFAALLRALAYIGVFCFSHTQTCSKRCTEYLGRCKVIQNAGLYRHVMFYAYSGIFTKLRISKDICPHWD